MNDLDQLASQPHLRCIVLHDSSEVGSFIFVSTLTMSKMGGL